MESTFNVKYWCFNCKKEIIIESINSNNPICSICGSDFIEEIDNTGEEDRPDKFKPKISKSANSNLNNNNPFRVNILNNSTSIHTNNFTSNTNNNAVNTIRTPFGVTQVFTFSVNSNSNLNSGFSHVNVNDSNFSNILNHFESSTLPMINNIMNNPFISTLLRDFQSVGNNEKPPTSKEFIKGLEKEIISKEDLINKFSALECCVCKDDYKEGDVVCNLPCNHYHHLDCIVLWLNKHNTCPVCRYELPSELN